MIVAVVPAAGHSQRMGRPKLILPVEGRTVISRVVTALRDGGVETVVVVAPPADAAGATVLHTEAQAAGAELIVPETRPADMRASFEHALDRLESRAPLPTSILLVPADSPGLKAELVALVIDRVRVDPGRIVVPVLGGERGHPVALPWAVAREVRTLPEGVGVNTLLGLHAAMVVALEVSDPGALSDLDTPDDYRRWVEPGGAEPCE